MRGLEPPRGSERVGGRRRIVALAAVLWRSLGVLGTAIGRVWGLTVDLRLHFEAPLAVENDYNLLVHNLNELADTISSLRDEVRSRRLREADERLHPNETDW
jgi:hypothetical protein